MSAAEIEAAVAPSAGIHENVPAETYHAWDLISNSRLSILQDRTPAHLRAAIDNPPAPTEAQVIGTATHVAVLEPDLFPGLYVRAPKFDRRTTKGKTAAEAFEAENTDRVALAGDAYDLCIALRDAVQAHSLARSLIQEAAGRELSLVWDDLYTGAACKARLDGLARSIGAIVDLKTTTDASPREYTRSLHKWGYHRQAAFYLDGAAVLDIDCTDFAQVVVEKSPPYGVVVYRIDEAAIEAGRRQLRRLIRTYSDCLDSGVWPAYSETIQPITLPPWAWSQIEAEGI